MGYSNVDACSEEEENNSSDAAFQASLVTIDVPTEAKIEEVVKSVKILKSFYQTGLFLACPATHNPVDNAFKLTVKNMVVNGYVIDGLTPITFNCYSELNHDELP
ncbi:hypothetical protein RF11_03182 [Thelohanellus kitauei]|uniref:Uncharacterized protein n=1 Tax=Thelohanellus kitauei TaxID=669202 RepID=A0A0C2MIZ4_THEKT|nr:hypothetical protein RF11_03182 [Thelohanellus kitauei]